MRSSSVSPYDLQDWAKRAGFELTEETLPPLAGYLGLLIQWNRVMNLVGTRTAEDTFFTLVVDSLHLGRFLREDVEYSAAPCCWDLGSGAGLPGLPLRMIWQEGDYWLVEAREKRALFLSTVLAKYPLPGTHVFRGRAEAFMAGPPARTADLIVSRAFMPWPGVLELVKGNLNPNGVVDTAFARTPPRVSGLGTGRTELAYCRAIYVYGVPHPAVPVCPDRSRRTIIHKTKPSEKTSFQPIEFFWQSSKTLFKGFFYLNSDSSKITNLAILILFLQEKKVTKRTKKRI